MKNYLYEERVESNASYPSQLQIVLRDLNAWGIKWRKEEERVDPDNQGHPQGVRWRVFVNESHLNKIPVEY